ncbi:TIGR03915 family putative DNA repair protein [Pontibacter sp. SGAir0037]|uniref:TIGR03915 family putative DNA repair protein n=1 Tax=Pontibacter sp. SGAir0037 TaxID=2571030 RepID=UPI0010CD1D70|nr:TIGR03915 family putative DNA repair protein [Pontibacter sp. SGAir0037]QCR24439.1 DNA metabolism protein [Pontibacter sp. SGAir0037]
MNLCHYSYDGSFEGLLTIIFEAFERKVWPISIEQESMAQPSMFYDTIVITADAVKAGRVWKGLEKRLTTEALQALYYTYLSEQPEFEKLIFDFARLAFESKEDITGNFTVAAVLKVQQIRKQVHREKHRMEAFVRFQKTADNLFYAAISPDYNVLPLIQGHFERRYADQQWAIYDTKRHYGLYYDLTSTAIVTLDEPLLQHKAIGILPNHAYHLEEEKYQQLWQVYFKHVNIPERRNPKLHLRHMPKRYWKFLSEKQSG